MSYCDRLKTLRLPSLAYRRFQGDIIQVYKLLHNLEDIDYNRFFQLSDNHTRGHALKLKNKSCKKEIFNKSYFSVERIARTSCYSTDLKYSQESSGQFHWKQAVHSISG